jgi:hypothetical protein
MQSATSAYLSRDQVAVSPLLICALSPCLLAMQKGKAAALATLDRSKPVWKRVKPFVIAGILSFCWTGTPADEPSYHRESLFHIERSKNANIVQYDAQVGPDNKLHPSQPVLGYWVRLAEQGQVKEFSWLQKMFAYGFKVSLDPERESAELKMVADIARTISVRRDGDAYKAFVLIDGEPARLERIYVQSSGKGLATKVHFMDLFGTRVASGTESRERLVP